MTAPIKVGILGCGVIAPVHVDSYRLIPGVEVQWACDLIPERAAALAQRYAIPQVTTRAAEVLSDPAVTAISVCTDHASHAELVAAALAAGKHVLCEKPLAADAAGLDRMLAAAAAHPEQLCGGVFQHRFDPISEQVQALIAAGVLGRMLTADLQMHCLRTAAYYEQDAWRGTWRFEGGSLMINQAIHYVDLLSWFTGGVEALCAAHANLDHQASIETEDTLCAVLRLRNGALGSLSATSASLHNWDNLLSFQGTEGALELRNGALARLTCRAAAQQAEWEQRFHCATEQKQNTAGKSYYGTSHPAQIANFIAAIQGQAPLLVPLGEAAASLAVVLACYASQRRGAWVTLPTDLRTQTRSLD